MGNMGRVSKMTHFEAQPLPVRRKGHVRIGYARVSTCDQSTALQLDALREAGCTHVFEDKITGISRKRPGLEQALRLIGQGDELVVWKLDRLGRSLRHLTDISEQLHAKGANFVSLADGIHTGTHVGDFFFHILGAIAEFERTLIIERTRAGLIAARRRGRSLGRKPKLSPADIASARAMMAGGMKAAAVAERLDVGRATLFRAIQREVNK
jgi:DNA invertase Pin-like site-specific DNA recombinase